ncbi:transcription factor tau subunit sfc7 [Acrasis kona]|uniref:Transcription factor tau subunit sfc7 n=1 Tax=Acrasis kona TaxID=1008807 RepID=A0AAW2Z210_9EUKA
MDIDEEEDYDDMYIYLEANEQIGKDLFGSIQDYSITGLETNNPIVRLGDYFFEGEFDEVDGTALFFEHQPDKKVKYKPEYRTRRVLRLNRILVRPKNKENEANPAPEPPVDQDVDEDVVVDEQYEEDQEST